MPEDAEAAEWIGLFRNQESGYRLARTGVSVTRFHDAIVDADTSIKTGKTVKAAAAAGCQLLIQGLDDLPEGPVPYVPMEESYRLEPGKRLRFEFLGTAYVLAATADSGWSTGMPANGIRNYRVYLGTTKGGARVTQLVVALPGSDDKMMSLQWAGDLDRDGRLDLILDDSNHYNASASSLYLSGFAWPGGLLKRVASHVSTGC